MNTIACHYVLVRFMPFVETGEFANVGVVVFAPKARFFGFKLLGRQTGRLTRFFDNMQATAIAAALKATRSELTRVQALIMGDNGIERFNPSFMHNAIDPLHVWQEVIKPRAGMVRMDGARLVMASDPARAVEDLFKRYVGRDFATPEYQEKLLEDTIRSLLKDADLDSQFKEAKVGNEAFSATFPFVEMSDDVPVKAIKTLRLDQGKPERIIDHGGQWRARIEALRRRNLLPPQVLFAVSDQSNVGEFVQARAQAREEVIEGLRQLDVWVVPASNRDEVLRFATKH